MIDTQGKDKIRVHELLSLIIIAISCLAECMKFSASVWHLILIELLMRGMSQDLHAGGKFLHKDSMFWF